MQRSPVSPHPAAESARRVQRAREGESHHGDEPSRRPRRRAAPPRPPRPQDRDPPPRRAGTRGHPQDTLKEPRRGR